MLILDQILQTFPTIILIFIILQYELLNPLRSIGLFYYFFLFLYLQSKNDIYKSDEMIMDNLIDYLLLFSQLFYQLFNTIIHAFLTAAMTAFKMSFEIAAMSADLTVVILQNWRLFVQLSCQLILQLFYQLLAVAPDRIWNLLPVLYVGVLYW